MYVTRPLSLYRKNPETLSTPPPEGPNSGILVIQDEDSERSCCFGLCKHTRLRDLPFPQNVNLTIQYTVQAGDAQAIYRDDVMLIPVPGQPLSSNRYYAISPDGKHRGEAYTSSKEEDMRTCCFCRCVKDIKPRPLDPKDPYQQFEIYPYRGCCKVRCGFHAKSVAPEGYPPSFLRREAWEIYYKTPKNFQLGEALGLDSSLRKRLPDFNFPSSSRSSESVVVGKWYVPFMFVKDGGLRDQVKRSPYYEMTLEQKWEQFFCQENKNTEGLENAFVDVAVDAEKIAVNGIVGEGKVVDGVMWFEGPESGVGLSMVIYERMRWEVERFGWVSGERKQIKVRKVEECGGASGWGRSGRYVLVESFVLKRIDGSLLLTYDFKNTHHIRSKCE